MMSPLRGTIVAGLLCSALAGCGSVAASSAAAPSTPAGTATSPAGTTTSAAAASAPTAVGCAAVDQATSVTVRRVMHLVEPTRAGAPTKTQDKAALVRALFGQFCAAVQHPSTARGRVECPADFGISYTGTFYDGRRELARFVYGASGCQTLSLTADGKTRSTMVSGTTYAAAPKLQADMAAVLEVPRLAVGTPGVNPGGPNKPLR